MPEPKTPQDHKAKKKPVDEAKTVTLDGHDYVIDPAVFDDLEFLELYEDQRWIGVLRMMLGPRQWAAFKENHADENGRVTGAKFAAIMDEFAESDFKVELGN